MRLVGSTRGLAAYLRAGGLLAYPTRGSFGLGCLPGHRRALRRLVRIKRRPLHKGLIVVSDRIERLRRLHAPLDPALAARAATRWPGHWTWLVPVAPGVPRILHGRGSRIALRVDDYPPVRALCAGLRTALVSTSANRSGQRPARTLREVRRRFGPALRVLAGRCEPGARPSVIADLASGTILRS
jgi:L-threonylcarbamoyladenylate synthase